MNKQLRGSLILFLTAAIWGLAFVAQTTGGDAVGPFSFNCIRSFIGSIVLLPVIFFLDKNGLGKKPTDVAQKKTLWIGGISCGVALSVATNLQQLGINIGGSASKAGFLTTFYILMVPILGLFFKRKCGMNIWVAVVIALIGMYFLCIDGSFAIQTADILLLACAFVFSIQIMMVDHFAPLVDGVRLSSIQFFVCGIITSIPTVFVDITGIISFGRVDEATGSGLDAWLMSFSNPMAWITILYAGVMSCGVAYTLQIIGQRDVKPTVASLIMSFESVFATIGGFLILHERLTFRQLLGCGMIFAAVLLAQLGGAAKDSVVKANTAE